MYPSLSKPILIHILGLCPCVVTGKSRHCLPNYGLIFFPVLNQSITALPSIRMHGEKTQRHSGFLSFNCAGREAIIWEVFVLPGGHVLRGVWSCRIDVDNPYVLVVEMTT